MNSYKDSAEWQALNKIWKTLSKEEQTQLSCDFKLISKFIETNIHTKDKAKETKKNDKYEYLSPLSQKCTEFIISNNPNMYHSMMAVLASYNFADCKEFTDFYYNKYKTERPHIAKNKNFVKETAELCWQRYYIEGQFYSK